MSTIDPTKLQTILAAAKSPSFAKALENVETAKQNLEKAQKALDEAEAAVQKAIPAELATLLASAPSKGGRKSGGSSGKARNPKKFAYADIEAVKEEIAKKGKISYRPAQDAAFGEKLKALIGSKAGFKIETNENGTWVNVTYSK